MAFGKNFLWDLLRTGTDASLGALISLLVFTYIFHIPLLIIAIGVVGGVLPDALQLVYYKLRPRFMTPLQSFHGWIQQTSPLDVPLYMGLGIQVAFLFAVITAEKVFLF
jgi:hypothetical protein